MGEKSNLTIRQFERREITNAATIRLYPDPEEQVRFAPAADAAQGVPAQLADLSQGGMGLRTHVYIPRACYLRVRVETTCGLNFETRVRVQRVRMIDRKPTYMLGTKFDDGAKPTKEQLDALSADSREAEAA